MAGVYTSRRLFGGMLTHPATQYVGIPVGYTGLVGVQIAWKDATSSATITLETSNYEEPEAPTSEAGAAWEWVQESTITIVGPTGIGADAGMNHWGNFGSRRARLKIVTAANTDIEIRAHGKST